MLLQGLHCQDRTKDRRLLPPALSRLSIPAKTVYIYTLKIGQTIQCGDWVTGWTIREPCGSIPSRGTRLFSTRKQISAHCILGAPGFLKIGSASVILLHAYVCFPYFLTDLGDIQSRSSELDVVQH